MSVEIPIDSYIGQLRKWLKTFEAKLLAQIASKGRGVVLENDGGFALSCEIAGTPWQNLKAVRYALNGRTADVFPHE